MTYLLTAFSSAIGINIATRVKDAIVRPKLEKNN